MDLAADLQADLNGQPGEQSPTGQTLQGSLSLESKDPFWDKVGIDPLLDDWFREQTPDLTPQTLWQAMQRRHPLLSDQAGCQGGAGQGADRARRCLHHHPPAGTARGVDLAADQWQLDLRVLNKGRCASCSPLARPPQCRTPDLGWVSAGTGRRGWEAGVRYPRPGRSGTPLWRPRPPAAQ